VAWRASDWMFMSSNHFWNRGKLTWFLFRRKDYSF
jgi:hypothetical protein